MHPPQPIQKIPELEQWTVALKTIASQPLEFCPDFPKIAQRFEAWWNHDCLDRPVFICSTNSDPIRPITRRLELLENPERWFEEKMADLRQIHRIGEALPYIRPDFGPVILGGLFGGRVEFGADTSWTHAFIKDDWSNAPDWKIHYDHPWWPQLIKLSEMVAIRGKGKYLYHTPNFGSSADILLNLRGSTQLCLDVIDQPDKITLAVEAIYPSWRETFQKLFGIAIQHGVGVTHYSLAWSSLPHTPMECDFSYMIGKRDFERLFLPDIERQAATLDRCLFHLDGPGAVKHLDALLTIPSIQAIQYVPGDGTPSALPWIKMFQKIQAAGKSVQIVCPASEVPQLCDELEPEGVCFLASTSLAPNALDQLFGGFTRRY